MPELEISYRHQDIQVPPSSCQQAVDPKEGAQDSCHFTLPLRDKDSSSGDVRMVRFDRRGDHFILSSNNAKESISWYKSHSNTSSIENILRFSGGISASPEWAKSKGSFRIILVLSQFVTTGEIRIPGMGGNKATSRHLADGLLESFAGTPDHAVSTLMGQVQLMKASPWFAGELEAIDRIDLITNSVLPQVPKYRRFKKHLLGPKSDSREKSLRLERPQAYRDLAFFSRRTVFQAENNNPLRMSKWALMAMRAFPSLQGPSKGSGEQQSFCGNLKQAITSLGKGPEWGSYLLTRCESFNNMAFLPPEQAAVESLRLYMYTDRGRKQFQESNGLTQAIEGLLPYWFYPDNGAPLPSYDLLVKEFTKNISVSLPQRDGEPALVQFDLPGYRKSLESAMQAHPNQKREYIAMGLGILDHFFGTPDELPTRRIFWKDWYQNFQWDMSQVQHSEIESYQGDLEDKLISFP